MAILTKGQTFNTGDQVIASKLNELVDDATFATGAVDDLTIALDSNTPKRLKVKDSGIGSAQIASDAVVPDKVSFVNDTLAATDGHVLVADGTEFNNVAISGDVSIDNTGAVTIADDAVTIGKIADAAIVTQSEGIGSNDNDATIPTSAAVKDYVDNVAAPEFAIFSVSDNTGGTINNSRSINIDGTVIAGSFASVSGGVLTLDSGTYEFGICGDFSESDGNTGDYWIIELRVDGSGVGGFVVNETGGQTTYKPHSINGFYFKSSSIDISLYATRNDTPSYLRHKNVRLFVRKLA
mgnify:FL=1